ncbi:GyrI-like domain-containing protein [Aureivirga marina]|uniref:GyrI-like domain-containing protein n=1 Tax=Aureivirga marina TaxID=1182451 RepID=UPI0018CB9F2B|nr:GyrI-like domain-containing protein [Aureivirga marina]
MEHKKSFRIVGISVETTNENNQALIDLGKLWGDFYTKNIAEKIPNKNSEDIYAVYTDYESDYTGKYTAIIGFCVDTFDEVPNDFTKREFKEGVYQKFIAKGKMPDVIGETWNEIWKKEEELDRNYIADFEIYGKKSQNGDASEVEIFIGVNN